MWQIERTSLFTTWIEKESVDEKVIEATEKALLEFRRIPTKRTKPLFRKDFFEIWDIHLPDKENNRGKSGGFRLMLRLNSESKIMMLEVIIRRDNLNWKKDNGKYQKNWDESLRILKRNQF